MKLLNKVVLLIALSAGSAAFATSTGTVINKDSTAYVLIVEDEDENVTEVQIGAGQTIADVCKAECYLYLKGSEDYEYLDGTPVTYLIQDGRLVLADD